MLLTSRKSDLMLQSPTTQFLWRSRSFSCLTLLCTTVLCSPQWQETPKLCTKTFGAKTTQYSTTSTRGSHTLLNFNRCDDTVWSALTNYKIKKVDTILSSSNTKLTSKCTAVCFAQRHVTMNTGQVRDLTNNLLTSIISWATAAPTEL